MKTPLKNPVRVIAALCPISPMATDLYSRFREPRRSFAPKKESTRRFKWNAEMAAATAAVGCPGFESFAARSGLAFAVEAAWTSSASFTAEHYECPLNWQAPWRQENNG